MKTVYSNKYQISYTNELNWEYEVLNELKDLSSRRGDNCKSYNRFLFEIDTLSLDEQRLIIQDNLDIINRVVFSANKSFHSIIQLDTNIKQQLLYNYYKNIHSYINQKYFKNKADTQTCDPARLTRTPRVYRDIIKDGELKSIKQSLLYKSNNTLNIDSELVEVIKEAQIQKKRDLESINNNLNSYRSVLGYSNVQRYLTTPFPKLSGNKFSSRWLYSALCTAIEYNDNETKEMLLNKARIERWSDKELSNMISNIERKIIIG